LEVVSSPLFKYCTNEIEILADGTWKPYEKINEIKNINTTPNK